MSNAVLRELLMICFSVLSCKILGIDEWKLPGLFNVAISCCLRYIPKPTLPKGENLVLSASPETNLCSRNADVQEGRHWIQKTKRDKRFSVQHRSDFTEIEGAQFISFSVDYERLINNIINGILLLAMSIKRISQQTYLNWVWPLWIWLLTDHARFWLPKPDQKVYRARRSLFEEPSLSKVRKMTLLAFPTLVWAMDNQDLHRVEYNQHLAYRAFAMSITLFRKWGGSLIGIFMGASTVAWVLYEAPLDASTPIHASLRDPTSVILFLFTISSAVAYMYAQCLTYRSCPRTQQEIDHQVSQYINYTIAGVLLPVMGQFLHDRSQITPRFLLTSVPALLALWSFLCSLYGSAEWIPELNQAL